LDIDSIDRDRHPSKRQICEGCGNLTRRMNGTIINTPVDASVQGCEIAPWPERLAGLWRYKDVTVRIAVGSDHAGFALKEYLKPRLKDAGVEIVDCGCNSADRVDYLEYTLGVAWELVSGHCELGIVVCGNGYGMAMVANRIPGIRAAICHDAFTARTSKEAGDSNIISLGARVVGPELAWDLVQIWLKAEFKGKTVHRYARRLEELAKLERLIAAAGWQDALEKYMSNRAEQQA